MSLTPLHPQASSMFYQSPLSYSSNIIFVMQCVCLENIRDTGDLTLQISLLRAGQNC